MPGPTDAPASSAASEAIKPGVIASANSNSGSNISAAGGGYKHPTSPLGDASGISILLGNHAKFGLAERCCYHFDLIGTLTSLPAGRLSHAKARRRERGLSVSSGDGLGASDTSTVRKREDAKEGKDDEKPSTASSNAKAPSSSDGAAKDRCHCGVVSLLECVAGGGGAQPPDRTAKRALRAKHREFNARAQAAWGRGAKRRGKAGSAGVARRCHQPRHLPLSLNPNTRVSFAYELTSVAIVVDASPSLTSTYGMGNAGVEDVWGEEKSLPAMDGQFCVPLDRLGTMMKSYLQGLVRPIEVPPVAVSGLGVAFGSWRPNLAVTVVAAYPPVPGGAGASAGLLVRDFRVTDDSSALELAGQIERWALREVEGRIANRLCGGRDLGGNGDRQFIPEMVPLGSFSFPPTQQAETSSRVKSSMKDMLAIGDAALSTLPPEGRPVLLFATDCANVHVGGVFDSFSETARTGVPVNVLSLTASTEQPPLGQSGFGAEFSPFQLRTSDDSQALRDACRMAGGLFLDSALLDSHVKLIAGSPPAPGSPLDGDYHFCFKRRSLKPNALQWSTLFMLSPFTPGGSLPLRSMTTMGASSFFRSASVMSISGTSVSSAKQMLGKPGDLSSAVPPTKTTIGPDAQERVAFAKYNIQPVRIKSLLMTRVLEGYRARRYGHNTQDNDKVSVHLVLRLPDCGIALHYEASFISSPYHIATVGQAHIKLELSGDPDFIQTVKKVWTQISGTESITLQGKRVPAPARAAADKICKLLRWTKKEDYLESYLCLPGWGDIDHFAPGSSFLGRVESLSKLQRYRHFRSESFEVVTIAPHFYEKSVSLFSDMMDQNPGREEMYSVLSCWSSGVISDREMYFKEIIPAQEDDLAYYAIVRVVRSPVVTRLFSITVDFHGEITTEQRLAVLSSLKDALRGKPEDIIVLEKCISDDLAIRPASTVNAWSRHWNRHFFHHKSWELLKEDEVLPLITKRRSEIGHFFILESNEERTVFAKFVKSQEERLASRSADAVIYQFMSRPDGIFVDIHMEATPSTFFPFRLKHPSSFKNIYENVKRRDKDCAKNVRSRAFLLGTLGRTEARPDSVGFVSNGSNQAEDVLRLIRLSRCTKKKLRFFGPEAGAANDILCRFTTSFIASDSFHSQAAQLSIGSRDSVLGFTGVWFIMQGNWDSVSVMCLESDQEGGASHFRYLSFFTIGIMDLYQSDQDVSDVTLEATATEDDSEHLEVSETAQEIEAAHARNFAKACYAALRDASTPVTSLQKDEVDYALSSCNFEDVLEAFVAVDDLSAHLSSDVQTITGAKLGAVIETLLYVVPGSDGSLFFYHGIATDGSDELLGINIPEDDDPSDAFTTEKVESAPADVDGPPLFFRFTLNQELVGLNDILALKKSATLAAQISILGPPGKTLLPPMASAASKLQGALDSFTSEQTLEKYRFGGAQSLTEDDFNIVVTNLPKTKHFSSEIPLEFFISRAGALVPAKNPSGNESDFDYGFRVLLEQLDRSEHTIRAGQDSFLVLDDSASRGVLPYWCYIRLSRSRGGIVLRVHHPLGVEAAEAQAIVTAQLLAAVCERTNQLLLLDSLYKTKNASTLLICEEGEEQSVDREEAYELSAAFSCPEQFREKIPLHRRCVPQQATLALETSILQNFMVGNRPGYFVYKDESEHVFYLRLNWYKVADDSETEQNAHIIELLVYGCDEPGPSITSQLVSLLRRKLLTLTLDALSSLLKKNPWFNLLPSDMAFIETFGASHRELGRESTHSPGSSRTYELPAYVKDPLILLLMLRQNLCGSTFIQHLHHESSGGENSPIHLDEDAEGKVERLRFAKLPDTEFQFYFNSSPSQLDPDYQPLATLTSKGREYSRQAGSGIAIIEVNLQQGNSSECQFRVGDRAVISKKLHVSPSDISLRAGGNHDERFKIRVDAINTSVDIDVIHKWVELSLSQVLAAWSIERHLESIRGGFFRSESEEYIQHANSSQLSQQSHLQSLDEVLPGLPVLMDMISIASEMPHPAIVTVEHKSMMSATALAGHTLTLLEGMISSIFHKRRALDGVEIIRCTGKGSASRVDITKESHGARVQTAQGRVLRDKPTSSPEYVAVFGVNSESQKSYRDARQNQFFREVLVAVSQQESSVFTDAIGRIKSEKSYLFRRHLVFILRVSRSSRTLFVYNANPAAQKVSAARFTEIEQEATRANERSRTALQSRCLRGISFLPKDSLKPKPAATDAPVEPTPIKEEKKPPANEEAVVKRGPARRIPRPTSMLRPTLIGKSVDGAAAQAVAASRRRATIRPNVPQRKVASHPGKRSGAASHREKAKETSAAAERRVSAAERRVSDSNTKATPVARSAAPRTGLLKTYRAFLSLLKEGPDLTSQPRLNQSALQQLWHAFLVSGERGSSPLIPTRIMSMCYGNLLSTGSIEPLQCDSGVASATTFVNHLTKRWGAKKLIAMAGAEVNPHHGPRLLYLKKELLKSPTRKAVLVIEVSTPWDSYHNSFILCYKCWLVNTIDKKKADKRSRKAVASARSMEREAAMIEAVALDFLRQLDLEEELFDLSCLRAAKMARGVRGENGTASVLSLLKAIITRWPGGAASMEYKLQRRFLAPSSFLEGPLLESCEKSTLAEHLVSNCDKYNLTCCGQGGDSTCLAGRMKIAGLVVRYFIAWHETVPSALDVFVLCVTKGQNVNGYITNGKSPIAEKISDVVLYSAMSAVQDLIEKAAERIRKDSLWKMFGKSYTSPLPLGSALIDNAAELRSFSSQLDLISVDSRLELLLSDEKELNLSWRDVLAAITRSPSFSHCVTFDQGQCSEHLVYCKDEDIFLCFTLDQLHKVQEAKVMSREPVAYDESSTAVESVAVRGVVQKFTAFLLQWMWIDCEMAL